MNTVDVGLEVAFSWERVLASWLHLNGLSFKCTLATP